MMDRNKYETPTDRCARIFDTLEKVIDALIDRDGEPASGELLRSAARTIENANDELCDVFAYHFDRGAKTPRMFDLASSLRDLAASVFAQDANSAELTLSEQDARAFFRLRARRNSRHFDN